MIDEITFSVGGRTYVWSGGYGAIFKSFERGVSGGEVRVIYGTLFHAYVIYPRWWPFSDEVCWTLPDVTNEGISAFRAKVFGY